MIELAGILRGQRAMAGTRILPSQQVTPASRKGSLIPISTSLSSLNAPLSENRKTKVLSAILRESSTFKTFPMA